MPDDELHRRWWHDVQRSVDDRPDYVATLEGLPEKPRASLSLNDAFGTAEAAQAAKEEAMRDARAEYAKEGVSSIQDRLCALIDTRRRAAYSVIADEDLRGADLFPDPNPRSAVREWWLSEWRIQALRSLLPESGLPPEIQELEPLEVTGSDTQTWTARDRTTERAVDLLNEYYRSAETVKWMNDLDDLLEGCGYPNPRSKRTSLADALRRSGAHYEHGDPHSFCRALATALEEVDELPQHLARLCKSAVGGDGMNQ